MHISFLQHWLEIQAWSHKQEMLDFLRGCDVGSVVLGESSEQEREFYSVVVNLGYSGFHRLGVGICCEGHGIAPGLLLEPGTSTLAFGFNSDVVGVRVPDGSTAYAVKLDSVFYRFLPLPGQRGTLVLHEIGVVAMSETGDILWSFGRDVITAAAIEKGQLYLEFMDSSPVYLDLSNGRKSKSARLGR